MIKKSPDVVYEQCVSSRSVKLSLDSAYYCRRSKYAYQPPYSKARSDAILLVRSIMERLSRNNYVPPGDVRSIVRKLMKKIRHLHGTGRRLFRTGSMGRSDSELLENALGIEVFSTGMVAGFAVAYTDETDFANAVRTFSKREKRNDLSNEIEVMKFSINHRRNRHAVY